jgi:hypothetical protein
MRSFLNVFLLIMLLVLTIGLLGKMAVAHWIASQMDSHMIGVNRHGSDVRIVDVPGSKIEESEESEDLDEGYVTE